MWQFIKGTGLRYGLVIDGYVDERRDPEKSTRAAARYLQDLYRQFGSWYLAAASYNCGERRVQQELNRSNHQNFWELSANRCLPGETKNYVPQIIAATIIAKNPERFGFKNIPYQAPLVNMQMAARAGENAPGGIEPHEAALRPLAYSLPPGRQAAARARQSNPNSKNQVEPAKKPTARATYAKNGKSATHVASNGKPAPQTASMFGAPAAPNKNLARKDQANKQTTANHKGKKATQVANGKNKKPSPALFAKKGNGSHVKAKLAKKSPPSGANTRKVAKTKPKPLLVSEAR